MIITKEGVEFILIFQLRKSFELYRSRNIIHFGSVWDNVASFNVFNMQSNVTIIPIKIISVSIKKPNIKIQF